MTCFSSFDVSPTTLAVTCEPKLDPTNKCFVIDGGVSLAIEDDDSSTEIASQVQNIVKGIMDEEGGLLSSEYPEVKDVDYLREKDRPTSTPTVSVAPTSTPTTHRKTEVSCPGHDCDFETGEKSTEVKFYYSIETSSDVTDPTSLIPGVEEALLDELADILLGYCLSDEDAADGSRLLSSARDLVEGRRLGFQKRRRLAPIGVCSDPVDIYAATSESLTSEYTLYNRVFI